MILSCQGICKSFGTDEVLRDVSFHIEAHEKAAIVGINGAGKSTLLKIIMREEEADSGLVVLAKGKTIGYLAQYQDISGHRTVYEEVLHAREDILKAEARLGEMERRMGQIPEEELAPFLDSYHRLSDAFELQGGNTYRSEVGGVIKGLGFSEEDFGKPMDELSGGQKTRVALGRLLVSKPDVLLLDEPTNHLDMESIRWLEGFLMNYRGAVLIVAHDRYFLDRVVTKVIEISLHRGTVYQGNYTAFAQKKAKLREDKLRQYFNQQREIRHQEEVIARLKSFNREKSIRRAESREKRLGKMERMERPVEENTDMRLALVPDITSGKDVLSVSGLAKSYPPLVLFSDLSFEVKRGERVALIGNNGTGKTTLLKIINGLAEADGGSITLGTNVHIGYYDQEHALLHDGKTIFEEISDDYPSLNNTRIRSVLAAFLFTEDDVFKRVGDLSGGERGRVSLAKLMLSDANFLILDEPTNHLDITSKEILESALNEYEGTVFFVSHDRYFINRTATRILELSGRALCNYLGNYDYYLEKREEAAGKRGEPGADGARRGTGTTSAHKAGFSAQEANAAVRAESASVRAGKSSAWSSPASAGGDGTFARAADAARGDVPRADAPISVSRRAPGTLAQGQGSSASGAVGGLSGSVPGASTVRQEWKERKAAQARMRKLENDIKKEEERISELEGRIAEIDAEYLKPEVATDPVRLGELAAEQEACRAQLEERYETWEELSALLEG